MQEITNSLDSEGLIKIWVYLRGTPSVVLAYLTAITVLRLARER